MPGTLAKVFGGKRPLPLPHTFPYNPTVETNLLQTKLYIPSLRPSLVPRPHLVAKLDGKRPCKLILLSAPAGYGKTTLVTEWIAQIQANTSICWLSLDEDDSDPHQFFNYLAAAIRPLRPSSVQALTDSQSSLPQLLQSPQPPPAKKLMAAFVNDAVPVSTPFTLILDDYHAIESAEIDGAMAFLLDHMPPQMTLVITSRADPSFPISRLRARDELTELRASDLRFTETEAAEFLQQSMGLTLSSNQITALESRTEGWIAGLQMAALSMQNRDDIDGFVASFTGSHRFIMDYLVEEVLNQQPAEVQAFLLQTAVLTRLCADLCDAVRQSPASQQILEQLDTHNIFLIPLDNERHWYRYHHLFADLLRQRLHQQQPDSVAELHSRASQWYEDNGMEIEAFHHAVAANDVEHAARLVEGDGMPLHFRGAVAPVLNWLASLPTTVLDARPSLWVMYASALSMTGQLAGVEEKLQAAEAALQDAEMDDKTRNLIGHIAAIRALLAAAQYQVDTIIAQSRRALAYLHPDNLAVRTATIWKLGIAYQLQGDRAAASRAYSEAISISQASGNTIINISATIGLGNVQETENQLYLAAETYRRVLQLVGDPPQLAASEAYLGLARIFYEWNDLDAAQQHGQQSIQLARQIENTDRFVPYEVFLARLKLAQGDVAGAAALLAKADQFVRQHNFVFRAPEVAAARVRVLLHQGNLATAAHLAETHELPIGQARVHLAQGDPSAALAVLEPLHQQMEAKGWQDEHLKVMVLQAVALHVHSEKDKAVQLLADVLALAEPGGFIRLFVDEGLPMAQLLSETAVHGIVPNYVRRLLAAFPVAEPEQAGPAKTQSNIRNLKSEIVEPLSQRELEVLQLIAQGLSNREISERLFLALSTVKGHNRIIFSKLAVQRRTEAVARARELGLLV